MKLLPVLLGAFILTGTAGAASPREQLKQLVEKLQKSPEDNALRVKLIQLASQVKPAPAVPAEAEEFEGRAQFAFKSAKSLADYADAAAEYEKAVAVAPWVAGYYSDLCSIYEKAEKYAEAKKNCEFNLASSPSGQEASDLRKRIAGLKYALEKGNSTAANEKKDVAKKLAGVWAISVDDKDEGPWRFSGTLANTWTASEPGPNRITMIPYMSGQFDGSVVPAANPQRFRLDGTVDGSAIRGKIVLYGYHCPDRELEFKGEVLRDGQAIRLQYYSEYFQSARANSDGSLNCGREDKQMVRYLYRQ